MKIANFIAWTASIPHSLVFIGEKFNMASTLRSIDQCCHFHISDLILRSLNS